MKKLLILIFAILWGFTYAQISTHKDAIMYHYTVKDVESIPNKKIGFENLKQNYGAEIAYARYLNASFNLKIPYGIGRISLPENESFNSPNRLYMHLGAEAQYKLNNGYLFKESACVAPYLFLGAHANYVFEPVSNTNLDLEIPGGLGINWKIAKNTYITTQAAYRFSTLRDYLTPHLQYNAGLTYIIGEGEKDQDGDGISDENDMCPTIAGIASMGGCPDSDNDGIKDSEDACPKEAGLVENNGCPIVDSDGDGIIDAEDDCPNAVGIARFNGCPDSDNDGVKDEDDKCPNEAGTIANNGCPVKDSDKDGIEDKNDDCPNTAGIARFNGCPDTDGDGIKDSEDRCPTTAGPISNNGCPELDSDKDGVLDKLDKCPTEAGTVANNGCPEIKEEDKQTLNIAMNAVQFETGSATLKSSSYATLDKVVEILNRYKSYSCDINGHTDNVGSDATNMTLSQNRAKACYDYLIKKGISSSRLTHQGFGETSPIADNSTNEGRARNRRVEFKMVLR